MRKLTFLIISVFVFVQILSAQSNLGEKNGEAVKADFVYMQPTNCSPYTAMFLSDLKQKKNLGALVEEFDLITKDNFLYVNSFIKTGNNFEPSKLQELGIQINTNVDNIYTALIPIDNLEKLFVLDEIEYVEIAHKAEAKLDEARLATKVDQVHSGTNLSQAYTGDGVIVGIIDVGLDYTHPTFYNEDYTEYRINRVWEQTESGSPPNGFDYGNELIGQTEILNNGTSSTTESHGTHVAGTAAGSGSVISSFFKGVAIESEIVLVPTTMQIPAIADGIYYIFDYANSVEKPAVINMSIGSHIGPHDGTSLFDQYCDGIVSAGRILVGSAGNEGSDKLHLDYNLGSEETVFSFVEFPGSSNNTNGETLIDMWGENGDDFVVSVNIYDAILGEFVDYTDYISTETDGTYEFTLYDSDPGSPDPCTVEIGVEHANSNNNKPHVLIYVNSTAQDDDYHYVLLEVVGTNTSFDAWCNSGLFTDLGGASPLIDGNTNSTMGEIGGTGNSMISVGAFTSKNNYFDFQGNNHDIPFYANLDEIAPFSSLGPTADGRKKPDITAPGNVIVSSVNSFDGNYHGNSPEVVTNVNDGNIFWWFATMQGTSMSSPMVAGIIALWLEANPNLTPDEIKDFMQDNAITDSYTGGVPNNTWGYGKIDAYETIKAIENSTGIEDHTVVNSFLIYPNPSNGRFTIDVTDQTITDLQIFDISGKMVYHEQIVYSGDSKKMDLSYLKNGVYFLKLSNSKYIRQSKLLINKH